MQEKLASERGRARHSLIPSLQQRKKEGSGMMLFLFASSL